MTGTMDALSDVMARRSQWFSADDLKELDSQTIDLLVRHAQDRELTRTWTPQEAELDRLRAVKESRHLYRYDVVSKRIIGLWTDFGYGKQMEVIPRDAGALAVWKEFVNAQRNAPILKPRRVHMLSDTVLMDGEIYLAFFVDKTTGDCTVRRINTDQITQLVPDVDDEDSILYYKREWTRTGETMPQVLYYRDWQAEEKDLAQIKLPVEARKADGEMSETDVVMMQIAHDEMANRGWPLMTAGAVWTRAYKNFLQDRAAVAKAVASVVDKLTAKGGSRGIEAIRRRLESSLMNATSTYETNPPPVAGSTWIENEALSRQRMPLSTGAGDAQIDGAALLGMVGLSGGIYAHWLGRGEAFRLATATAMESPTYRQFLRYQAFWEDAWRDIAKVVFWAKTEYGAGSFEDEEVDIASDAIIQTDIRLLSMALGMAVDKEFVTPDIALERFLSALGVKNVATIVAEEAKARKERQAIDDAAAAQARAAAAVSAKAQGMAPPGASNKDAATMLARNAAAKKTTVKPGGDGNDG